MKDRRASKCDTRKMRQCRTWKIDGVIDILRNKDCDFDPEPTTIPYVPCIYVLSA